MEEKLRKLMKQEGINSTRLAEMLGIQASGISHIMSGRNKPSYDFLLKLLQRFPQLNPDWLILDKGPMYRDEIKKAGTSAAATTTAIGTPSTTAGMAGIPTTDLAAPKYGPPNRPAADEFRQGTAYGTQDPGVGLFADPGRPYEPSRQEGVLAAERDNEDIIPAGHASNPAGTHNSSRTFAPSSSIERIVVFYKDKTFSEYQPA